MSQLTRNQSFDPALQCSAQHPQYGERCQIFGALRHTGKHQVVVQVAPNRVQFCWWEDPPPVSKPLVPLWWERPRSAVLIVAVTALGVAVAVLLALAAVVWLMN